MKGKQKMAPILAWAKANGWTAATTGSNHIKLTGHGATVFAPKTPSDARSTLNVMGKLKRAMRNAAVQPEES